MGTRDFATMLSEFALADAVVHFIITAAAPIDLARTAHWEGVSMVWHAGISLSIPTSLHR